MHTLNHNLGFWGCAYQRNRPILRGRDIKKFNYEFADLWLINTHNGIKDSNVKAINVDSYPAVKEYLNKFNPKLAERADKGDTPYNLRNCAYMEDFLRQKIVWGEISDRTKFAIDLDGNFFAEATSFIMSGKNLLFFVAYLNSKLSSYLFSKLGTTTGVGTIRWKKFTIEQLIVPNVSEERIQQYDQFVTKLIEMICKKKDSFQIEKELDFMVYEDFELTEDEVIFIESQ